MKVNVLGTEYEIIKDDTGSNPKLEGCYGYFEAYSKKIVLENDYTINDKTIENFSDFEKKVLRHEIIHAFFHEAGLRNYCEDEVLVDFLSFQIPKMIKAMNDSCCLE